MDQKKFYKQLSIIVLPIAVQNFMSALVGASDALMLGFLNQEALSAVSLATQIQFVQSLFLMAITIGLTILAAQYWGKKDTLAVEQVLGIALRYSTSISILFSVIASVFPAQLMSVFTNEEALISAGAQYLRLVAISYIFTGVSQIYLCVMKNSGRVARSTVYGSIALILNLILNAIFIFGLIGFEALGIRGAALATVIARTVELAFVLWENRRNEVVSMKLYNLIYPAEKLRKDFIKYTTPVMANEIAWGCGFTMFSVIMGHLGNDAIAASSIANIVKNLIACVALGIGTGSGIMVGNELGRGNIELAKKYGDRLCRASIVIGVLSGVVILMSSPLILKFSGTLSWQSKNYLKIMLYICAYYIIGKSVNSTVIAGIFCAGGDTKFGFWCDLITMWVIVVPLGAVAAFIFKWPVMVVYFILNLDEVIKLPAVYRHYKKYKWLNNLTQELES